MARNAVKKRLINNKHNKHISKYSIRKGCQLRFIFSESSETYVVPSLNEIVEKLNFSLIFLSKFFFQVPEI